MLEHYQSPGLPSYPYLMYDEAKREAYVMYKHPTWRSYERGLFLARFSATVVYFVGLGLAWELSASMTAGKRILAIYFGGLIAWPLVIHHVREALWGFLARRVFPRKLECWFTSNAIGIRSEMFPNGIVLWRTWNETPVVAKFTVSQDEEARVYSSIKQKRPPGLTFHFQTARILRVTLGVETAHQLAPGANTNSIRAVPICEIDEAYAERATMVFAAAAALTSDTRGARQRQVLRSGGHDIDLQ